MANVVVIGCGWGQLALTMRLAARGHRVGLLVAGAGPPTWAGQPNRVLVPAGLRELFSRTGCALADSVAIEACEPALTIHMPDGRAIALPGAGVGPSVHAVRAELGSPAAQAWRELIAGGGRTWAAMRLVAPSSSASLLDLARSQPVREVGMLALAPAVLAGLAPAATPAAAVTLAYLEATFGVWQVRGGPAALGLAMIERMTALGATIAYDTPQVAVLAAAGRVARVTGPRGSLEADTVVIGPTADPPTMRELALRPGPDVPGPGSHVWFPSGVDPRPGQPLAIAGWVVPTSGPTDPAGTVRLMLRMPPAMGIDQLLDVMAIAGTDLRPHLVGSTQPRPDPPDPSVTRPDGDPAGLILLGGDASAAIRAGLAWAPAATVPWTGMTGQLIAASAVHLPHRGS
jgi:hypothetical protein